MWHMTWCLLALNPISTVYFHALEQRFTHDFCHQTIKAGVILADLNSWCHTDLKEYKQTDKTNDAVMYLGNFPHYEQYT